MTEVASFDERLAELDDLIRQAGEGLLTLVDEQSGDLFIRDTRPPVEQVSPTPGLSGAVIPRSGATSTNRAVVALVEFARFLAEENTKHDDELVERVVAILKPLRSRYLSGDQARIKPLRHSKDNNYNIFTDSHFVVAALLMSRLDRLLTGLGPPTGGSVRSLHAEVGGIAKKYAPAFRKKDAGGRLDDTDPIHDFLTLYALRAFDLADIAARRPPKSFEHVATRVLHSVLHQLAYNTAEIGAQFDPAELTFSIAVLNRFSDRYRGELTHRAIRSIVDAQRSDGSWSPARPVTYKPLRLLHIASYEVALALVDLLLRDELIDETDLFVLLQPAFDKTVELIRGNRLIIDGRSGWTNDHTRAPTFIESWATAIVLTFLIHWRDAVLARRQHLILKAYKTRPVAPDATARYWPDMPMALFNDGHCEQPDVSDPTSNGGLAEALNNKLIAPARFSPIGRPKNASFVIYGPPGSRKTSLVRAIATALRWPLMTLSPPDFLANGLDGFEKRAAEVFTDLMRLRRVVLLFDECEPFFLRRSERETPETRTQGAFITAGMLPRLQDLRDQRWIIFALATNVGPDRLDSAVTRPGRFDYQHHQSHPTVAAQVRYVAHKLRMNPSAVQLEGLKRVCDELDATICRASRRLAAMTQGEGGERSEMAVSFQVLDELVRRGANDWLDDEGRLRATLKSLIEGGPPRLAAASEDD